MQGLGNDFIVIDAIHQVVALSPEQIRFLANRRLGVGCDQVLLVEVPRTEKAEFRYRIFNADGNEVEQCGNGARCFARFIREQGFTNADEIIVETAAGIITLTEEADGQVTVNMGVPRLLPTEIPFVAEKLSTTYVLAVDKQHMEISAVSMGNPHAILIVNDVQKASVAQLGPYIESHERFPNRTNVGFMEIVDSRHIRLRVYERGVGETLACGTGACAAVVAGHIQGLVDELVKVDLPGGRLIIGWQGDEAPVMMTGPAIRVFDGMVQL